MIFMRSADCFMLPIGASSYFFRARENSRERADDRKPKSGDEINFDSLVAYMRARFPDREHEGRPAGYI